MSLEFYIQEYPDLEEFLQSLENSDNFSIEYTEFVIKITIKFTNSILNIHTSQLELLTQQEYPVKISALKYLQGFGIKYKDYYEVYISIFHHGYTFFYGNDWRTDKPLRFKIDTTQFEIGPASELMVLLTEPIFYERKKHYNFKDFASLKMNIVENKDYEKEFIKGLFYLNSHYLLRTDMKYVII